MGRWIPRKLLEWREPKAVVEWRRRQEGRSLPPAFEPLAVLGIAAFCVLTWALNRELRGGHPIPAWAVVPFALGTGVLFVYLLPALTRRFPPYAWISELAVSQAQGNRIRHRLHDSLARAEILSGEAGALLRLTGKDGSTSVIGLPPDLDLARLRSVLAERGVPLGG